MRCCTGRRCTRVIGRCVPLSIDQLTQVFLATPHTLIMLQEERELLNPFVYSKIGTEKLRHALASTNDQDIPLFAERLSILHDAGNVLLDKFDGKFANVVKQCDKSAVKLIELLCEHFPSFRDVATYRGKEGWLRSFLRTFIIIQ